MVILEPEPGLVIIYELRAITDIDCTILAVWQMTCSSVQTKSTSVPEDDDKFSHVLQVQ